MALKPSGVPVVEHVSLLISFAIIFISQKGLSNTSGLETFRKKVGSDYRPNSNP